MAGFNTSQQFKTAAGTELAVGAKVQVTQPSGLTDGSYQPLSLTAAAALRVDGSSTTQPISASSLPLPTGASTATLQSTGNASLASIDAGIPAALGAATIANSMPVNIASDQVVPISAASLPLPAGASTSALQTSGNATLTAIAAQLPVSLGIKTSAGSLSITPASDAVFITSPPTASSATLTQVAASATSVTLLASRAGRKAWILKNDSASATLFYAFTATATSSAYTDALLPGSSVNGDATYTGVISGIWTAAVGNAILTDI